MILKKIQRVTGNTLRSIFGNVSDSTVFYSIVVPLCSPGIAFCEVFRSVIKPWDNVVVFLPGHVIPGIYMYLWRLNSHFNKGSSEPEATRE